MGFIMDVINEGFYGACVNAEYERICRRAYIAPVKVPEDYGEVNDEEDEVDIVENIDEVEDDESSYDKDKVDKFVESTFETIHLLFSSRNEDLNS